MNRMVVAPIAAGLILSGLLGWKLWEQGLALRGPTRGSGVVEGTDVDLSVRIAARVLEVYAEEGQKVEEGDLLLTLDCAEPEAGLAEAEARLAVAMAQADAARAAAGAAQHASGAARSVASAAQAQSEAAAAQRDAAARQAGRLDAVSDDVSSAQRDQARAAATGMDAQTSAAIAQGKASSQQAQAAQGQASAAEAQAQAADQAVAAGQASVFRVQLLVDECAVRSPISGMLELLPYEVGELVQPGARVARVVDLSKVKAAIYVPNSDLGKVAPGQAAKVVADAWKDQVFDGHINTVSSEAEFTPRNIQTRSDRDRLVYRVEVEVDNPDGKLRPGMPVEVTVPEVE